MHHLGESMLPRAVGTVKVAIPWSDLIVSIALCERVLLREGVGFPQAKVPKVSDRRGFHTTSACCMNEVPETRTFTTSSNHYSLSVASQASDAKLELWKALRALDHGQEERLPAEDVVTALKRMNLDLKMSPKKIEKSLRVFEASEAW